MKTNLLRQSIHQALTLILVALPVASITAAPTIVQTQVREAKSCATAQQDVELGRQAAGDAEKQFQMLSDARSQEYLNRLGQNLAQYAPGERFQYSFKLLNVGDINAFALPGGFTYVNRGTIEAAKNEAELAGVMAHEIAHVSLRHGTANMCKAQNMQGIAGAIGSIFGNGIGGVLAGVGANVIAGGVLMRNSRAFESDADVLGSQIMARAGYDPNAMADFFETLAGESRREPGKLEKWFSDHPQPTDRRDRIKKEAAMLGNRGNVREVGGFTDIKRMLQGLPKAPAAQQAQQTPQQGGQQQGGQPVSGRVAAPSTNLKVFSHPSNSYSIAYPDNWNIAQGNVGVSATLYPTGGAGQEGVIYGVLVDSYLSQNQQNIDPRTRRPRPASFETITKQIIDNTLQGNNYLKVVSGPTKSGASVGGRIAYSTTMEGLSPISKRQERALLFNMQLNNGDSLYVIFVTPTDEFGNYQAIFRRMLQSMKINN
jgi:beta-barrel assembly-enhancing protease